MRVLTGDAVRKTSRSRKRMSKARGEGSSYHMEIGGETKTCIVP